MGKSIRSRQLVVLLALLVLASPFVAADIIGIASFKNCSNATDPACNHGQPFSLQSIINGTTVLTSFYPGTTTQAFYLVQNDVSAGLPSFSFNLTGPALPSNHFLTCQVNGAFAGDSCSITGPSGTVGTGAQYGPPGLLPATITFSGFSLAANQKFELTFASFGQNTVTAQVPEPPELALLLVTGFVILGAVRFGAIRFRGAQS